MVSNSRFPLLMFEVISWGVSSEPVSWVSRRM